MGWAAVGRAIFNRATGRAAAAGAAGSVAVGEVMKAGKKPKAMRGRRAPKTTAEPDESHDTTNKLFGGQIGWDLFDRAMSKVNNNLPSFTHSITVTCQGGPLADLRRTYYLALAAAFGRWQGGVAGDLKGSTTSMVAHIDVTGKAVAINISYSTLTAVTAVRSVAGFADTPLRIIQQGPDQVTVGGSWPSFLETTTKGSSTATDVAVGAAIGWFVGGPAGAVVGGGIGLLADGSVRDIGIAPAPTSHSEITRPSPRVILGCNQLGYSPVVIVGDGKVQSVYAELPQSDGENTTIPWGALNAEGVTGRTKSKVNGQAASTPLPDAGRVITTGYKFHALVQPPKPPIDGNTRGSLVALVAQALSAPCYRPLPVPCNPRNPLFSTGLRNDAGWVGLAVGDAIYTQLPPGDQAGSGAGGNGAEVLRGIGPDGYPVLPANAPTVRAP